MSFFLHLLQEPVMESEGVGVLYEYHQVERTTTSLLSCDTSENIHHERAMRVKWGKENKQPALLSRSLRIKFTSFLYQANPCHLLAQSQLAYEILQSFDISISRTRLNPSSASQSEIGSRSVSRHSCLHQKTLQYLCRNPKFLS